MTRPGYNPTAQERRECPKCRYPMLRWAKVQATPERIWLAWTPERWLLPWPYLLLGGLTLLAITFPLAGELLFAGNHRRGYGAALIAAAGSVLMTAVGWLQMQARLQKRRVLAAELGPDDWVCPNCLYAEYQ